MLNLYRQLLDLLPADPMQAGTVSATHSDGSATITLDGGGTLRVANPINATPTERVFIKSNAIQSTAPSLPTGTIDV